MPSSRDIVKKAGGAAAETALRAAMPQLQQTLDTIQLDLRQLDGRLVQVEERIERRFNQLLDAINQLHERVIKVEARVDAYVELTRQQLGNTQSLIERIVR